MFISICYYLIDVINKLGQKLSKVITEYVLRKLITLLTTIFII